MPINRGKDPPRSSPREGEHPTIGDTWGSLGGMRTLRGRRRNVAATLLRLSGPQKNLEMAPMTSKMLMMRDFG